MIKFFFTPSESSNNPRYALVQTNKMMLVIEAMSTIEMHANENNDFTWIAYNSNS